MKPNPTYIRGLMQGYIIGMLAAYAIVSLAACEDIEHFTDPPEREEPKEISVPPIPQDSSTYKPDTMACR